MSEIRKTPIDLSLVHRLRTRRNLILGRLPGRLPGVNAFRSGQVDGLDQALEIATGRDRLDLMAEGREAAHALSLFEQAVSQLDVSVKGLDHAERARAWALVVSAIVSLCGDDTQREELDDEIEGLIGDLSEALSKRRLARVRAKAARR